MKTLLQMRDHVKGDLDLDEETFVDDTDIDRWLNEGIAYAEGIIHTLYEDYFLVETEVAIVSNQNKVDYPSDIYANKIRKIIFYDGNSNTNSSHQVHRLKNLAEGKELDLYNESTSNPILKWSPTNDASEGRKMRLFPKQGRPGTLSIWYIRNAKRLVADSDVCDIDEYESFVIQYAKTQAYLKDGDPRADDSLILQKDYELKMIENLSEMTPDDDNYIEEDMSHYDDMIGGEEY